MRIAIALVVLLAMSAVVLWADKQGGQAPLLNDQNQPVRKIVFMAPFITWTDGDGTLHVDLVKR
jgi:hypothetical protein